MATQTRVMRGYGVGHWGRLSEVRSRIGEYYAEFKEQMAWGSTYDCWSNFIASTAAGAGYRPGRVGPGPTSQ